MNFKDFGTLNNKKYKRVLKKLDKLKKNLKDQTNYEKKKTINKHRKKIFNCFKTKIKIL